METEEGQSIGKGIGVILESSQAREVALILNAGGIYPKKVLDVSDAMIFEVGF